MPHRGFQGDAKALQVYGVALNTFSGCSGPFRRIREWLPDSSVGNRANTVGCQRGDCYCDLIGQRDEEPEKCGHIINSADEAGHQRRNISMHENLLTVLQEVYDVGNIIDGGNGKSN
jgi:hypothetical protein